MAPVIEELKESDDEAEAKGRNHNYGKYILIPALTLMSAATYLYFNPKKFGK